MRADNSDGECHAATVTSHHFYGIFGL